MSTHPHADLITEWVKDTSRVVEYCEDGISWHDWKGTRPSFEPNWQWRFKPTPRPDVVRCEPVHLNRATREVSIKDVGGTAVCRFVFDGETGALKSAEVLK